ncbi:VSP with INR [Giardia lamblia P15]|uniref:VSP with INR n=1 Tax=Giardia intestinalis (strain P15) TaxID=658858 RepID=E1F5W0_GIAIA|nr:VSP with INR [Giardia lamblia P15]
MLSAPWIASSMFDRIFFGIIILQATQAAACQVQSGGSGGTCEKCDAFIGQVRYCSKCNQPDTYAPVNGVCEDVETQEDKKTLCKAHADGTCTTCGGNSFMFEGGCYSSGEGLPGHSLCLNSDGNGVCTEAAPGYFLSPLKANNKVSVVSCSDTTGITDTHTYKGVQYCDRCDGSQLTSSQDGTAECTKCGENKYLTTAGTCGEGCTPDTEFLKEDLNNGKRCFACGDVTNGVANCEKCTAPSLDQAKPICTKCGGNKYLKTAADGTATCVEQNTCTVDSFPVVNAQNGNKCVLCGDVQGAADDSGSTWKGVDGCSRCRKSSSAANPAICEECAVEYLKVESAEKTSCVTSTNCNTGFFPTTDSNDKKLCTRCNDDAHGGIADCSVCSLLTLTSRSSTILIACSACVGKKLSPLNNECMTACPAGTYDDSNVCRSCHDTCSSCYNNANADSCTTCYPGYVLKRDETNTKGTCIKECTGDLVAYCKSGGCTLDVGGSKYCDQCEDGYAPIDGICTKVSSTARDASGCKASGGKCTECGPTYALLSGGCYDTQKLPGKSVCTAAQNKGQCQTCANGQAYAGGNCPACTEGCVKCAGNKDTCTGCLAGYYLSNSKCFKCDADDSQVTGVSGCVSCAPPAGGNGPVTCYVKIDGTNGGDDSTGGSVNKGGLSTGAIAGIAVAVVIVIGGLVGFLCWWFICRGKA